MDGLAGILCCVIGIIASIGSIILNLVSFNYQGKGSVKIGSKEFNIEVKKEVEKVVIQLENKHNQELVNLQKEIKSLKETIINKNGN